MHRTDRFFTKYVRFRSSSIYVCNNAGNDFDQDQYCVSKRKLLMCAPLTSKKTVAVGLEVWAKPLSSCDYKSISSRATRAYFCVTTHYKFA